jgi:hypothetical protein
MHNYNTKRIIDFKRSIISRITTDESFERPYGCWNKTNQNGFIQDVFLGHAATPIVVADVNSCRDYSNEIGDTNSYIYYNEAAVSGKRFISLDGKHRTQCIEDFMDNKISYSGKVVDLFGNVRTVRNKFFKDLEISEQQAFFTSEICLTTFQTLVQKDLSRVFLSLNANSTLSNQHKRNAVQTPMSAWSREQAKNRFELMNSVYGKATVQMAPEEFISKLYIHCVDGSNDVGQGALNRLYREGVGKKWDEAYCNNARILTEEILDNLTTINKIHKLKKGELLYFSLAIQKIIESGNQITDDKKFVKALLKLEVALEKQSRTQEALDREAGIENSLTSYYFEQIRLNWTQAYRSKRQETIWAAMKENLCDYGISPFEAVAAK